jgi:2-iminobutanoate/2-iminopropanoate deaminase
MAAMRAQIRKMNQIYSKWFVQPCSARTTIGVAALPLGATVEIDLVVRD